MSKLWEKEWHGTMKSPWCHHFLSFTLTWTYFRETTLELFMCNVIPHCHSIHICFRKGWVYAKEMQSLEPDCSFIHSLFIHSLSPAFLSFYSDPQIRHPGGIFTFNTGVDNTFNSRLEWSGWTLLDAVKVATIPTRGAVQFRCGVNQNQSSDKHDPSFSLFCFRWKGNFSIFVGRVTTLRTACLNALLHSCKSGL